MRQHSGLALGGASPWRVPSKADGIREDRATRMHSDAGLGTGTTGTEWAAEHQRIEGPAKPTRPHGRQQPVRA